MKRLFFSLLSVMLFAFAQAQSVESGNTPQTDSDKTVTTAATESYSDYHVGWSDKAEILSFRFGGGPKNGGYFTMGYDWGFGDISIFDLYIGYGLHKRVFFGDSFLIQGKIWPYLGFSMISYEGETESEYDFIYGASAQLEAGLKMYTTKKGNDLYLTVGYDITAPEFDTDGMIDNGTWQLGVTMKF